ncbi:glycosyltransferase [Rhizomonospora bruguierae]|uniref:glycosyltransferase n=1 Tax=Rhizomonospora bruguierae TaxID=1581705 RepID=UPI001BD00927|nr:glycosyltransferase [Micromonospora sp. NBRC 107566]
MATVLMVTHGTAGDVLPFARIGSALARQGHEVTLCTHAPYERTARRAGLDFAAVDTGESYVDMLAGSAELLAVRHPADLRRFYQRSGLFAQMRREVDLLAERHRPDRTVLVGRHTSALSVRIAADLLGAPAAWVAVAPVQLVVAPVAAAHAARGLAGGIDEVRAEVGLAPVGDWSGWLRPAHTIGLWPRWFEEAGTPTRAELAGFVTGDELAGFAEPTGTEPTGAKPAGTEPGATEPTATEPAGTEPTGSEPEVPAEVAALLAGDQPPVLVTGGTGQLLHERFYPVALDAVARTGRAGLVVTPDRAVLPDRLPAGLHWYPRLPFPAIFPRVAAVLHHGGIGTAVRALRSATPQVIMAYGADRPDNAERLAAHGLARWTAEHEWSAPAVAAQLDGALADRGYRDRATRYTGEPEHAAPLRATRLIASLVDGSAGAGAASGGPTEANAGGELPRRLRQLSPQQRALLLRRLRGA